MNHLATTRLASAALSLGLFAASPADAVIGDAVLFGEYSATSTGSCLTAPSGFNDKLQPNTPEVSTVATDTGEEVWVFDGAGSVTVTSTSIRTSSVASSPSNPNTASASGTRTWSTRKYSVSREHMVTVIATNVMGENFAGTRAGQTLSSTNTCFRDMQAETARPSPSPPLSRRSRRLACQTAMSCPGSVTAPSCC
jgi:hypothetical protein